MLFLFLVICSTPAYAQRDLRIKTQPETPLPFVTTVVAPLARGIAVSEPASAVVAAHKSKHTTHLSVYKLDAQGAVLPGEPVVVMLPKPAALADRPTNVMAIACHPRYPLLYVWQDAEPLEFLVLLDQARGVEFDHLLIYSLEEPQPKLLLATCRGDDYCLGAMSGGMTLDVARDRLYIPNMQQIGPMKKPVPAIGWVMLEADGLPALVKADEKPAQVQNVSLDALAASPLDPAAAAAARAAKLAAFEQGKASGQPLVPKRATDTSSYSFSTPPVPYNYAPIDGRWVMLSGHSGPISWDLGDPLGRFCAFFVQPYVPYRYRVTVHPTQPAAYVVTLNYDGRIVWLQHADGHFTLTPQVLSVDNMVFHSTAIILPTRNQLALGANGRICLVDLDDRGRFKTQAVQMTVNNPTVEAIVWSDKFNRMYVPVEKTP